MPWTVVVRAGELDTFRSCGRAWDLGSLNRQRFEPNDASPERYFAKAVRDALAVYYFPAMDDWPRAIVRPLAQKGFARTMEESWDARTKKEGADLATHLRYVEVGEATLANYFAWAGAEMDDFDSIFSDQEVWAPVPDPDRPGHDLGMPDGRPVRYLGRVDGLIADPLDEHWIVQHRIVSGEWTDPAVLAADQVTLGDAWALQVAYPQLMVAGVIVNELRLDHQLEVTPPEVIVEKDVRGMSGARHLNYRRSPVTPYERVAASFEWEAEEGGTVVAQAGTELFRRTTVRWSQPAIGYCGVRLAETVREALGEARVAPTFSIRCARCEFRQVCDAMEAGEDPVPLLSAGFRRLEEQAEEDTLRRSKGRGISRASFGGRA